MEDCYASNAQRAEGFCFWGLRGGGGRGLRRWRGRGRGRRCRRGCRGRPGGDPGATAACVPRRWRDGAAFGRSAKFEIEVAIERDGDRFGPVVVALEPHLLDPARRRARLGERGHADDRAVALANHTRPRRRRRQVEVHLGRWGRRRGGRRRGDWERRRGRGRGAGRRLSSQRRPGDEEGGDGRDGQPGQPRMTRPVRRGRFVARGRSRVWKLAARVAVAAGRGTVANTGRWLVDAVALWPTLGPALGARAATCRRARESSAMV